jgi:hypothetical protein
MATKNARLARLELATALAGPYTAVSKTHGFTINLATDFSEDTSHGDRFKSYLPGLQDFKGTLMAWYDTAYTTLEDAALNRISYYFRAYMDYTDSQNYYRGQCYFGIDELDLAIGSTVGFQFTMTIANADIQIIRGGAAI